MAMNEKVRMTPQTLDILEALLAAPSAWRYGYDLSRDTELASGTLYPILMRLAKRRWLETRWEAARQPTGKPPRHLYRLTPNGLRAAKEIVKSSKPAATAHQPAYGGVRA
jgi:PadR family transcriptional regulator